MIHYFKSNIGEDRCALPSQFTYPFHYTPHPLIVRAANEVNAYLETRSDWSEELSHGKMFGVLLIEDANKKIGYLAGFSGNIAGSNYHPFFVPPVFDLLQPGDFFKVEEKNISALNQRIIEISSSAAYQQAKEELARAKATTAEQLASVRCSMKEAKEKRDKEREDINHILLKYNELTKNNSSNTSTEFVPYDTIEQGKKRLQELIKESQFQKAEFKRLERRLNEEVAHKQSKLQEMEDEIIHLKHERKSRSAALQMELFNHFRMLNARGEVKDLCQIFEETRHSIPPAGTGECALPKMLQYAYQHQLKPLAFGEFWWGESPKDEIRQHGQFYPSCKGKCEPILHHMLIGLEVEKNPLAEDTFRDKPLKILYEDSWIVVIEKPAGMLSTPGKEAIDSVSERLHSLYPSATGSMLVHRLDMATSGILLAAKDKATHTQLQSLFEAREVRKMYTAILDGVPVKSQGCINLPLCLNPMDRPRQMVSYDYGKEAITFYNVIATAGSQSLVQFDLQTGRTHQIRMHAAHPLGLNCPIKGDELYGKPSDRLYLHATEIEFIHPVTKKTILLQSEVPFHL